MADTIWVTPHPSLKEQNRVALYETHPDHPKGEIAIDGADTGPHEVARTPSVLDALASPGPGQSPRLVQVDTPSRSERAALEADDPNKRQQQAAAKAGDAAQQQAAQQDDGTKK